MCKYAALMTVGMEARVNDVLANWMGGWVGWRVGGWGWLDEGQVGGLVGVDGWMEGWRDGGVTGW